MFYFSSSILGGKIVVRIVSKDLICSDLSVILNVPRDPRYQRLVE